MLEENRVPPRPPQSGVSPWTEPKPKKPLRPSDIDPLGPKIQNIGGRQVIVERRSPGKAIEPVTSQLLTSDTRWGSILWDNRGGRRVASIVVARDPRVVRSAHYYSQKYSPTYVKVGEKDYSLANVLTISAATIWSLVSYQLIFSLGLYETFSTFLWLTLSMFFVFGVFLLTPAGFGTVNVFRNDWIEIKSEAAGEIAEQLDRLSLALAESPVLGLQSWNSAVELLDVAEKEKLPYSAIKDTLTELTAAAVDANQSNRELGLAHAGEGLTLPEEESFSAESEALERARERVRLSRDELEQEASLYRQVRRDMEIHNGQTPSELPEA